jgi:hypothetical protein
MGAESTVDKIESEAEWSHEALSKALDATAKKITICTHSKRWWNGEIMEKRSQLGREKRRWCRSAATAQTKAEMQKLVRRAKAKIWNDYLKYFRRADVWRAPKFASPRAGMSVLALTNGDWKQVKTIAAKEEMLRPESFPPNQYDQYFELPPAEQAHQSVTEQAVERAVFSQSVKIAPGPDKLSFGAVRLLLKLDKERPVKLVKIAVWTVRHPAVWKRAIGVIFTKPGKDDHTKLRAYRSISLSSCIRR